MAKNKNPATGDYPADGVDAGSVKKRRVSNFIARVATVILAIALWFYVIEFEGTSYDKQFDNIAVRLTGAEEMLSESGFSVISGGSGYINVTVTGKKSNINRLKSSDIVATVDLSSVSAAGERYLPVNVTAGNNVKVTAYEPTQMLIYVDSTVQREFVCKAKLTYSKDENLIIGEAAVYPEKVKVSGPAGVVDKIDHVAVPADLGRITGTASAVGNVVLFGADGNEISDPYVKTDISTASVTLPVYKQKTVTPVVRFTDSVVPSRYITVKCTPEKILVQGASEYIDKLGDTFEVASVSTTEVTVGTSETVLLKSIDSSLEYLTAESVTVDMSLDPAVEKIKKVFKVPLDGDNLRVRGLNSALKCTMRADSLDIEVRSTNQVTLDRLTTADISVTVDMSAVNVPGTYKLPVSVNFERTGVYTSEDYALSIEVTPAN